MAILQTQAAARRLLDAIVARPTIDEQDIARHTLLQCKE
jgi:hypothetical protein